MLLWIIFAIGVYLMFLAFVTNTRNFKSDVLCRFLPFLSGLFLVLYSTSQLGIFG